MIEPGNYEAKPTSAQLGYTQGGNEQAAVQFRTKEGYHITWYGYFTEKTTKTTLATLRTCGWIGDNLANLSSIEANPRDVELVIEQEADQQGNPRARVRWVNRPGGSGVALAKPMNAAQLATFADKMRGKVVAEAQADAANSPRAAAKSVARSSDDTPEAHAADDPDGIGF